MYLGGGEPFIKVQKDKRTYFLFPNNITSIVKYKTKKDKGLEG